MINVRRPKITAGGAFVTLTFSLLIVLDLYVRLLPAKYGFYLNEFDPYYHYYATNVVYNDIVKYGLAGIDKYFHTIDYNFWYPWGRNLAASSPSALYILVALIYLVVNGIGAHITLYQFAAILPILAGALIAFPAYFIIKDATGNKYAGLLAVLLLSSAPGLIIRTNFGWYKGSPLAFLFMALALYLLFYSFDFSIKHADIKTTKNKNAAPDAVPKEARYLGINIKPLAYSLIAGVLVGYAYSMWGGAENLNGVAGISFLLAPLFSRGQVKIMKRVTFSEIAYTIGALVPMAFPYPGGLAWIHSATMLLLYLAILVNIIYLLNMSYLKIKTPYLFGSIIAIIVAGLAIIAIKLPHLIPSRYLSVIDFLIRAKPTVLSTVAEQQPVSGLATVFIYGITVLLTIVAGYYLLKRKTPGAFLLAFFFLWSFYIGTSMGELMDFIGLAIVIGAPMGIYYVFESIKPAPVKEKKTKARGKSYNFSYEKGIVAVALLGLLVVPVGYYWIPSNNTPVTIVNSATIINGVVPAWTDALNWMSNSSNMPPHSVVVAWWDYGYWITVMGNQTTVVDNATINSTQIGLVAKMFLSPVNESINILDKLHGQYVVVFVTGVDLYSMTHDQYLYGYQETGQLYGIGGDESKVNAMLVWADWQSNQTAFIASNGMLTPHFWNDTLLGQLEPLRYQGWGQISTTTGQLVNITPNYINSSSYYQLPLFVYSPRYTSNSTPFSLVYLSPLQLTSNGMWAQVLIYKYVGS